MLITPKEMLETAKREGYCVCAPNFLDYGTALTAMQLAEQTNSPILLDIGLKTDFVPGNRKIIYQTLEPVVAYAKQARVPVAIQQDHGDNFEDAIRFIQAGATGIMVDRSALPFDENVAQVKELVKIAHACGVSVEAELGHVGQGNNYNVDGVSNFTDPDEAAEYVALTGVDTLAVAIGTAHGLYSGTPHLDFELLEKIKEKINVPLVLHGGSSTGDENLYKAAHSGFQKINIFSDLVIAGDKSAKAHYEHPKMFANVIDEFKVGYREMLLHYMELFGQIGKA